MRIDPKGLIGGYPALLVRKTLRHLRERFEWTVGELESAAALDAGEGYALVKSLLSEGLIEAAGRDAWTISQAGQALSSATAAKRVTRATAERALSEFLDRVDRVNRDPHFLGKVVRVVLFGSMLKPEVVRLSDVDVAVELVMKETDVNRAREENYRRAEELSYTGHRFRNIVEVELCWYLETRRFLKGGSRVIALADYPAEKSLILKVPHRVLLGDDESPLDVPTPKQARTTRNKRPRDCPF
jgi:predicted nucleotidyltransferase